MGNDESGDVGMFYRYCVSFHWSLAQFTPAPNNFHPHNLRERVYAIVVLFLGFGFFSAFLANVTGVVNQALGALKERERQSALARRFITESHISVDLGNRIMSFLTTNRIEKKRVMETEVPGLNMLPESLVIQMRHQAYTPFLMHHPFFRALRSSHHATIADACHGAMRCIPLATHEELFHFGMEAKCMLFVASGSLSYVAGMHAALSLLDGIGKVLHSDMWICEAVLWVKWETRGQLSALHVSSLVALDSKKFRDISTSHPCALYQIRKYARSWLECMMETCKEVCLDLAEVDDLCKILDDKMISLVQDVFVPEPTLD